MPSFCARRKRSVIGMPATPKIVSTPVQFQRIDDEVKAVGHFR